MEDVQDPVELDTRIAKETLLSSFILCVLYWFIGSNDIFFFLFESYITPDWLDILQHVYQFLMAFLLLFLIPVYIVQKRWNLKLELFGCNNKEKQFNLRLYIAGIVIVAVAWYGATQPEIQAEYPLSKHIANSLWILVIYQLIYLFYYIAWEFHFRGFLLFGLEPWSKWVTIGYTTFVSTIMHWGKPMPEILGAAFIGVLFGILALKGRSVYPFIAIHYVLGVLTDLFSLYQLGLLF